MSGAYDSHVSFYRDVYGHAIRAIRPAGRSGASLMLVEQEAGDWPDDPTPDLVIGLLVSGEPIIAGDIGAGHIRSRYRPGAWVVQPPNFATHSSIDSPHAFQIVSIPYQSLKRLAGEGAGLPHDGDFGRLHASHHTDTQVVTLLRGLWSEASVGSPHGALWADGALLQLAARLLHLRDGNAPVHARGSLAPWQLRRVQAALEDRLEESLTLTDLAAEVDLSEAHLSRAFKASTGLAPWRWLAERRIERAKALLADRRLSVTDVAQLVGYSGQNTFGEAFRRATGVTPGRYRREVLR